jgi:nitrate reductase assembly molybdenum cofactor insertion protein NarJ
MSKVNTMINLSYKEEISEDTLADFIKNLKNFDDERMEVLYSMVFEKKHRF